MSRLEEAQDRAAVKERELAEHQLQAQTKYGNELGTSYFLYVTGSLIPSEKRELSKRRFEMACLGKLSSPVLEDRRLALDAILTASEELAKRIANESVRKTSRFVD